MASNNGMIQRAQKVQETSKKQIPIFQKQADNWGQINMWSLIATVCFASVNTGFIFIDEKKYINLIDYVKWFALSTAVVSGVPPVLNPGEFERKRRATLTSYKTFQYKAEIYEIKFENFRGYQIPEKLYQDFETFENEFVTLNSNS